MKKKIVCLLSFLLVCGMFACNTNKEENQNENKTLPPAATQPPVAKEETDHTSVKISKEGVSVSDKEGGRKTEVKVSKDSSKLEIEIPK